MNTWKVTATDSFRGYKIIDFIDAVNRDQAKMIMSAKHPCCIKRTIAAAKHFTNKTK